MAESLSELVETHDIDVELFEAVAGHYGADVGLPDADDLTGAHRCVYTVLSAEGRSPMRTLEDHYYQFSEGPMSSHDDAPETEADFRDVVQDLVERGLVACAPGDPTRYSTSFYATLKEVGPAFTASEIDQMCAETGMDKRAIYYHIVSDLTLGLDVTR